MLRITLIVTFVGLMSESGLAQRSVQASIDFESYRPIGEVRGWTFVAKDSAIGRLISTVKKKTKLKGKAAIELDQVLRFDYSAVGTDRRLQLKSNHFVSERGHYLGDKMEITVNDQTESLDLERDGDNIEGFFTRSGNKIKQQHKYPENGYAADILFLDLYENLLAQRDIAVGDTILDSAFVPQTMLVEKVEAYVEHFGLISLYNQVKDSAFVIRFTLPQVMIFYFTPDKHLVKADFLSQQMKAYLDIVRRLPPDVLSAPAFTYNRFVKQLSHYGAFILIGALCLLLYTGADIYKNKLYLYVISGGVSFVLAAFTQVPLQAYLAKEVFLPNVSSGRSPFLWAAVPAFPAGVVQEFIKLGTLMLVFRFVRIGKGNPLLIGGAVGAGFGIIEAAFIISQLPDAPLWSFNLAERGFLILFHSVSGVLLASVLMIRSWTKKIVLMVILVLTNSLFRYVPVFVQRNLLDVELLLLLMPILPIILLVYCVGLIKRTRNAFGS